MILKEMPLKNSHKHLMQPPKRSVERDYAVKCQNVLAIASSGGHWVQLLRLRPAFTHAKVTFVTTDPKYRSLVEGAKFRSVCDATRKSKLRLICLGFQILWILVQERPDAIITTGAAPGYLAIRLGKWFGIKTLWIDSIANAEELSLSGQLARQHSDKILTQWKHLAAGNVEFHGAII